MWNKIKVVVLGLACIGCNSDEVEFNRSLLAPTISSITGSSTPMPSPSPSTTPCTGGNSLELSLDRCPSAETGVHYVDMFMDDTGDILFNVTADIKGSGAIDSNCELDISVRYAGSHGDISFSPGGASCKGVKSCTETIRVENPNQPYVSDPFIDEFLFGIEVRAKSRVLP